MTERFKSIDLGKDWQKRYIIGCSGKLPVVPEEVKAFLKRFIVVSKKEIRERKKRGEIFKSLIKHTEE